MTVVRQTTTNATGYATASPASFSGMVVDNVGTDRAAVARIAYDSSAGMAVSAVTYGGVPMVSCGPAAHHATSQGYVERWILVNPPTGSNTLVVTVTGTIADIYVDLEGYQNVNQVTPVRAGTYQTSTGTASPFSLVVASNSADLTTTAINSGGPSITSTNQTSDGIDTSGAYAAASDHATTPASSVTHTWTLSGTSTGWAIVGFSLNGDPTVTTFPVSEKPIKLQQRS